MSMSLLALLSQQKSNIQTRKGLILLGLQNDFLSPDGKLPVSTKSGFLDRLKDLVTGFREFGDVVWVRSEFEASRVINAPDETGDSVIVGATAEGRPAEPESDNEGSADPDEELFLTKTSDREPCCIPGTSGADYATQIKELVDAKQDLQVVKTYYSAFGSTSLLLTLRCKLITELYVCGCNTNLSVFATAMDAARYGIKITLVEDCLGYRQRDRHDEAIRQLREIMEADVMTSDEVIDRLKNPLTEEDDEEDYEEDLSDDQDDVKRSDDGHGALNAPVSTKDLLAADSDEEESEDELEVRASHSLPPSIATSSAHLQDTASGTSHAHRTQPTEAGPSFANRSASDDREADPHPEPRHNGTSDSCVKSSSIAAVPSACGIGPSMAGQPERKAHILDRHPIETNRSSSKDWSDSCRLPSRQSDPHTTPPQDPAHTTWPTVHTLATFDKAASPAGEHISDSMDAPQSPHLSRPLFGVDKEIESAGSRIYYNLLPPELADTIFDQLINEIDWQRMRHQTGEVPRLVACQGTIHPSDGSKPIYRHPSDQVLPLHPWTKVVKEVRKAAEAVVGHTLNHALIQLYRSSTDFISEHSDKTLDIVPNSHIVNVSFGAQRTMRLRTKRAPNPPPDCSSSPTKQRTTHRIPLPHNSLLSMSLSTNAEYLHAINADKRPRCELTVAEKAFESQRISLTFRHIGTFLSGDEKVIWGQGAVGKRKEDAGKVVDVDAAESERLVRAFERENRSGGAEWCWDGVYGGGSDVLNLKGNS